MSPDTIVFSKAHPGMAAEISTLVNSAYRGDSSKVGWTTEADLLDGIRTSEEAVDALLVEPDEYLLVAKLAGVLVGCCLVSRYSATDAYIGMVSIKPSLQGQRLGRSMLTDAERVARDHFKASHTRITVISVRDELIRWYERRGYQATGEREPFPMTDKRFGIPKVAFLEFVVLRKTLA